MNPFVIVSQYVMLLFQVIGSALTPVAIFFFIRLLIGLHKYVTSKVKVD